MCFGGGPAMPKTEIKETKIDYGPLPSLSVKPMTRRGQVTQDIKRGGETRSLLMPYSTGGQ